MRFRFWILIVLTLLLVALLIGLGVVAGGLILRKGKKPPDEEE